MRGQTTIGSCAGIHAGFAPDQQQSSQAQGQQCAQDGRKKGEQECSRSFSAWARAAVLLACLGASLTLNAFAHGDHYLRIQELTTRIEGGATNQAALYIERGELKRERGDFSGAKEDFNLAERLAPGDPSIGVGRGRVLAEEGNLSEALETLNRVVASAPDDSAAFIERGRVKARLKDPAGAAADYKHGIELSLIPDPLIYLELAEFFASREEIREALRTIDDGVKKTGPQLNLQSFGFDLELRQGNTNGALSRADEIIKSATRKETWHARRADLLLAVGKAGEARSAYEQAIREIEKLPARLQQTPPTAALKQRAQVALRDITAAGVTNSANSGKVSNVEG